MKTYFIIHITLLSMFLVNCSSNNTEKNIKEIDRLAEKYKGMTTFELPSSHGKIMSEVAVQYNSDSLPLKISLSGNTYNREALTEIISNLIFDKLQKGFKPETDSANYSIKYIDATLTNLTHVFRKDSMIFAVFSKHKVDFSGDSVKLGFDFTLVNADESRRFSNSSKIDF